jgi:hypothetical protein
MARNTPPRVFSSQDTSPLSSAPSTIVPPLEEKARTSDTTTTVCTPEGDAARIASPSGTSDSPRLPLCDASSHEATVLSIDLPSTEEPTVPELATSASTSMPETRTPQPTRKRSRDNTDDNADVDEEHATAPKKAATPKPKAKTKTKAKAAPRKPAAKKAPRPPPPPSTRPSRNRKAPERFADIEETKGPEPLKQLPMKKGASKVFDPVYITTNSTSRLGKADVYHMLLEPAAWTSLSTEQQIKLVSMLPRTAANSELLTRIREASGKSDSADTRPNAFTMSNDCFRTDVAKFKEDLKNGHLAKTWQASAQQAVIDRAVGVYDDWKAEETESWWGQKSSGW